MGKLIYPPDLVSVCKEAWERHRRRSEKPKDSITPKVGDSQPPFPPDDQLLTLLETVYHVSFLAEEGRAIGVRVIYVLPKTFEGPPKFNLPDDPARLSNPTVLSVGELLKLAPAVHATESAILVAPADSVTGTGSELMIWGVLHLGTEWWKILTGAESAAMCPPDCLTISSFASGSITISALGLAIARLQNGRLIGTPLPDLDNGPIGEFLQPAGQELYDETTKALGRKRFAEEPDSDQHPRHLYYRTLSRVLHLVREQRHGGSVLVIPDQVRADDGRLMDRLRIKYQLEMPDVWKSLVDQGVATSNYHRLLFPAKGKFLKHDEDATAAQLKELFKWEGQLERLDERIGDFCGFVAALSAVDGAVVMSRKLRVLGFGAEIIATSPSLFTVREALDPEGRTGRPVPLRQYGTRHRSAMRMCSSFEDCIALVVSQDGPVKAIKRVGSDVVMWNDVTLGRLAI